MTYSATSEVAAADSASSMSLCIRTSRPPDGDATV